MKKLVCRIERVVQETPTVKIFFLKLPESFDFKPGQFVMVTAEGYVDKSGRGPKRAYSIASAPGDKLLELVIKINPGPSFSEFIDTFKVGDELVIEGPYGKFFFHEPPALETVFVASGTGIAPLMSMIRSSFRKKGVPKPLLLFGVKTEKDLIYRTELDKLRAEGIAEILYCLSQEETTIGHVSGRVTSVLLEHLMPDAVVYVCGSPQMVRDVLVLCEERAVLPENIHKEQW